MKQNVHAVIICSFKKINGNSYKNNTIHVKTLTIQLLYILLCLCIIWVTSLYCSIFAKALIISSHEPSVHTDNQWLQRACFCWLIEWKSLLILSKSSGMIPLKWNPNLLHSTRSFSCTYNSATVGRATVWLMYRSYNDHEDKSLQQIILS